MALRSIDDPIYISSSDDEDVAEVIEISSEEDPCDDCRLFEREPDEDLPNIEFRYVPIPSKQSASEYSFSIQEESNNPSNEVDRWSKEPPLKILKIENIDVNFSPKKEVGFDSGLEESEDLIFPRGESQNPTWKVDEANFESVKEEIEPNTLSAVQRDMRSYILLGSTSFAVRYFNKGSLKKKEPICSTKVFSSTMIDTLFHCEIYDFGLRALNNAVSSKQSLSFSLTRLLLNFLYGCDEKEEAPAFQDFFLGRNILYKQLYNHPAYRQDMRLHYLKVCQEWWEPFLTKLEHFLDNTKTFFPFESNHKKVGQSSTNSLTNIADDSLFDFSDVVQEKRKKKKEMFRNITREEESLRLGALLKFFTDLFGENVCEWFTKCWSSNIAAFRKDISPILAEITWGKDKANFGTSNKNVRQIFGAYSKTTKEILLHQNLGAIISFKAAIIHRYEKSVFPEMGDMTRSYARCLYNEIKNNPSDLVKNVSCLQPDWLKFHVAAIALGVEEPANFFKMKETVSQLLCAIDKGYIEDCGKQKESLCHIAIRAMMGIMTLSSSKMWNALDHDFIQRLLEEETVWFEEAINEAKIKKGLQTLRDILCIPCVKNRKYFYFDGFDVVFDKE